MASPGLLLRKPKSFIPKWVKEPFTSVVFYSSSHKSRVPNMKLFVCLHNQLGAISRLRYLSESAAHLLSLLVSESIFQLFFSPPLPHHPLLHSLKTLGLNASLNTSSPTPSPFWSPSAQNSWRIKAGTAEVGKATNAQGDSLITAPVPLSLLPPFSQGLSDKGLGVFFPSRLFFQWGHPRWTFFPGFLGARCSHLKKWNDITHLWGGVGGSSTWHFWDRSGGGGQVAPCLWSLVCKGLCAEGIRMDAWGGMSGSLLPPPRGFH